MNSQEEILGRLLRVFPVKHVKESFNTSEWRQSEVIEEVLANNHVDNIMQFVEDSIDYTRQNVFIYSIRNNYNHIQSIVQNNLGVTILSQNLNQGKFVLYGYHDVFYDVKLFHHNQVADTQLNFKQPFKLTIVDGYMVISITKVDPNIKTFYTSGEVVLSTNRGDFENNLIHNILTYFDTRHRLRPSQADLNRGVKELWETDVIDAKEVSFRKTSSRAKDVMDGNQLYKYEYPQEYQDMMRNPLELCIFRYIIEDEDWPPHFTCDARVGKLSFNIFSTNINQIDNVIDGIIGNN